MKSFKAKLYIEDNLATIEFDVTMKGKYDEDYTPGWDFGIIEHKWIPEKKELSQTVPSTRLVLSIYNQDDMKMAGEIFQTDNHGVLHMLITSSSMDPETHQEEVVQEENLAKCKEISLQFLDLWLKGKKCIKYNFIYNYDEPTHLPLPLKHIRKGNYWDVYVKKPGETEFVYHDRYMEEDDAESMVEMKDVYEQIKHNKLSLTYPDGTPAKYVPTERDEDGTLKPKEN